MTRKRNQAREEAFANELAAWELDDSQEKSVDAMALQLEKKIAELTEKHFPLRRDRRRSNEDPWITRGIRRLWKRKLRSPAGMKLGGPLMRSCRTRSMLRRKPMLKGYWRRVAAVGPSTRQQRSSPRQPTAKSGRWPTSSREKPLSRLARPFWNTSGRFLQLTRQKCRWLLEWRAAFLSSRSTASPRSCESPRSLTPWLRAIPYHI